MDLSKEKKKRLKNENIIEFYHILRDILSNEKVQEMKNFKQHGDYSCYAHCLHVSYCTYLICKKLKLDYISATRAAMLHDLFLYDWHDKHRDEEFDGLHAFTHPKIALRNASQIFPLNHKEKDIIVKHMWPVTLSLPEYTESYIVTILDKYSALYETHIYLQSQLEKKNIYKYAYVFSSLLFFRVI